MLQTLLLLPRKKCKAPVSGKGKEERGSVPSIWPWAMAQLFGYTAQVMRPGTSLATPRTMAGDRGPSPQPTTQNLNKILKIYPKWHTSALSAAG